jgi:hypothetical protein
MGQMASPSLYDFAGGDPVNFFDPTGRCPNQIDIKPFDLDPISFLPSPFNLDPAIGGQNPVDPNIAGYEADMAKLDQIERTRIESFFGNLAARQEAAQAQFEINMTSLIAISALGVAGGEAAATAFAADAVRAAAAARSAISVAETEAAITTAATQAAQAQYSANLIATISSNGTSLLIGVSGAAALGQGSTGIVGAVSGSVGDLVADTKLGQVGFAVGVTQATIDYINETQVSPAVVGAVVADIHASVSQTRQAIFNRYFGPSR